MQCIIFLLVLLHLLAPTERAVLGNSGPVVLVLHVSCVTVGAGGVCELVGPTLKEPQKSNPRLLHSCRLAGQLPVPSHLDSPYPSPKPSSFSQSGDLLTVETHERVARAAGTTMYAITERRVVRGVHLKCWYALVFMVTHRSMAGSVWRVSRA